MLGALLLLVTVVRHPAFSLAQEGRGEADRFLAPHQISGFPKLYRDALDTFLEAQSEYRRGAYAKAHERLDHLWKAHPAGSSEWFSGMPSVSQLARSYGVNIGSPPCYYALRMLSDCAAWRASGGTPKQASAPIVLNIVLVGASKGNQPETDEQARKGEGKPSVNHLDADVVKRGHPVVEQSLWLFREYVSAITDGQLTVRPKYIELPNLEAPVQIHWDQRFFAGPTSEGWSRIWTAVPDPDRRAADWWWVIYPSNVPDAPAFKTTEFVTGGMGGGPDGNAACFIIDDKWLTRKPPHLGFGRMSEVERSAYLPQWLQHEFFHYVFRTYPEFNLEAKSHQWFDHSTWPKDFGGVWENDYYHEAWFKRIQKASPPPEVKFRHSSPPLSILHQITDRQLCGTYQHNPVENGWHKGLISRNANSGFLWTNEAGKSWKLELDAEAARFSTGPDNPYFDKKTKRGAPFILDLVRGADGRFLPKVAGFYFDGSFYRKTD